MMFQVFLASELTHAEELRFPALFTRLDHRLLGLPRSRCTRYEYNIPNKSEALYSQTAFKEQNKLVNERRRILYE